MLVEKLLTRYMRNIAGRYFTFQQTNRPPALSPSPGKDYVLYAHIPFCETLCPYCSFYRIPFEESLADRYFDCLEREIGLLAADGFRFTSVYVGGGTPTVLPEKLAALLERIQKTWPVEEISVETHTQHLTPDTLRTLKEVGVKRLSIGVQTFDRDLLQRINRHRDYASTSEIKRRIALAQESFATVNLDMIYNFPSQSLKTILEDIKVLKEIEADQITFYPLMASRQSAKGSLTQHEQARFLREKRFYQTILAEVQDLYCMTSAWCFSHRERCREGREGRMIDEYIVDYDEYAGVGAGAFGFLNGIFYANIFSVKDYMNQVKSGRLPIMAKSNFPVRERARYDFLMKLFGTSLSLEFMKEKYGAFFLLHIWREILISFLLGAVRIRKRTLTLTPEKAYFLVIIMREFFAGVNQFREICTEEIR